MLEFTYWWLLFALPLPLLVRFVIPRIKAQTVALNVSFSLQNMAGSHSQLAVRRRFPVIGLTVIWCLLVLAASDPRWLDDPITLPDEGRELMLAVDLSGSMKIEDMEINGSSVDRLSMVKYVLSDFIQRRVGDRLGLVLFADTAYLQAPMTYDLNTVSTLLEESVIGLVGEKTAIGDAVGLAVNRFKDRDDSNNVLVLLTDGQNTAGNIQPQEALTLAMEYGIKIYTVGVGANIMEIDSFFGSRRVNPSRDLDEGLLNELASKTGGRYFRARNSEELEAIYALLDELEPVAGDGQTLRPQQALFYYPLAAALTLLALLMLSQMRFPMRRVHG